MGGGELPTNFETIELEESGMEVFSHLGETIKVVAMDTCLGIIVVNYSGNGKVWAIHTQQQGTKEDYLRGKAEKALEYLGKNGEYRAILGGCGSIDNLPENVKMARDTRKRAIAVIKGVFGKDIDLSLNWKDDSESNPAIMVDEKGNLSGYEEEY